MNHWIRKNENIEYMNIQLVLLTQIRLIENQRKSSWAETPDRVSIFVVTKDGGQGVDLAVTEDVRQGTNLAIWLTNWWGRFDTQQNTIFMYKSDL